MLKIIFLVISLILAFLLLVYKIHISKLKRTPRISAFVSFMVGILLIYIIFSVIFGIFVSGWLNKLIVFILALAPFVLGKYVTYESVKFYSYLQIFIVLFGFFYVIIFV